MSELIFPLSSGRSAWNNSLNQSWNVVEEKTASGRRRTLCQQVLPSWEMNAKFPNLTKQEVDTLLGFYAQCKGSLKSFFYKGYDCHIENQLLSKGSDGKYQCVVNLGGYAEQVEKVDNVKVYVNGVETTNFTVADGKISLSASGNVTADYDFYWKVCFGNALSITQIFNNLYSASVKFEVVRE